MEVKMYRLGIIEESIDDNRILEKAKQFFISQRIEEVPEDTCPIWHTNEYHVLDDDLEDLLPVLEQHIKSTWYIHAFNDDNLYVILKNKSFRISREKDDSWNQMIEYGVNAAKVERIYLENIPLHI